MQIYNDDKRLKQIIFNIVSNAAKVRTSTSRIIVVATVVSIPIFAESHTPGLLTRTHIFNWNFEIKKKWIIHETAPHLLNDHHHCET